MVAARLIHSSKIYLAKHRDELSDAHTRFEKKLSAHALYKTNDIELSHDLVQTTFFKTLLYLQKGGKIDVMRSFLNHILHDLIIDEYRKRKTTSLDVLFENGFEHGVDDFERTVNILDGKEAALLIKLLPKKYQQVMRMRYLQDLSLKEMSVLTGQTRNTMAVQAHRGLAKLRILYTSAKK